MRILRLDLAAFGPFAGRRLDLCADAGRVDSGETPDPAAGPNLCVVYGPNEAGKSSALRAVRAALFGFDARTPDAHRHPYDALRVGLTVAGPGGNHLRFLRRKGNKDTLLDPAGDPLPDAALEPFLGSVTPAAFDRLHGVDLAELARGGDELLGDGGEVGQLLFGAAGGLSTLRRVRDGLREEAGGLFKARGKNPAINAALKKLKEERDDRGGEELSPAEYDRQCGEVRRLSEEREALKAEARTVAAELNRLTRLAAARGTAGRLADAERELADLDPAVAADAPLRAAAGRVRDLGRRAAVAENAAAGRADAVREIAAADRAAAAGLADLRPAGAGDDWVPPSPGKAEREAVKAAAADHAKLSADLRRAAAEEAAAAADVRKKTDALAACGALGPDDADALRHAADAAAPLGDPAAAAAGLEREIAALDESIAAALARLPGFGGTADELAELSLPSDATLSRFETDRSAAAGALSDAAKELARAAESVDRLTADQARLDAGGVVPTEADLAAARAARDDAWEVLKSDPAAGDAAGYETLVAAADAAADALRAEADRVQAAAALAADAARAGSLKAAAEAAKAAAEDELAAVDERWAAAWPDEIAAVLPPAEMRPWLRAASDILADRAARRAAAADRDALLSNAGAAVEALAAGLAALNAAAGIDRDDAAPTPADLPALRTRARRAIDRLHQSAGRREQLETDLAAAEADRRAAADRHAAAAAELDRWAVGWAGAVAPLGLTGGAADVTPRPEAAAAFVTAWEEADGHRRRAADLRAKLDEADAAADALAADAADAAAEFLPGDPPEDPAAVVDALAAALSAAEARAARHAELPAELSKLRRELDEQRAGEELDDFLAAARAADADESAARKDELEAEAARLADARDAAVRAVRDAEAKLAALDTRGRAAEAEQRAQDLLAAVDGDADRYARVRLADALLARAAERYRDEHQGPLLDRAGDFFARLTGGSFAGLDVVAEGDGLALVGVRPREAREDGTEAPAVRLPPAAMSDGTRDQLYFALRLAGLAQSAAGRPPYALPPLIVDDVLDRADDARCAAALGVLADLSESVQVVVFTHHARLAELAADALAGRVRFVPLADGDPVPAVPAAKKSGGKSPVKARRAKSAADDGRQKALL